MFFILRILKYLKICYTVLMEGELYSTIQKQELQGVTTIPASPKFPDISFGPPVEGVSLQGWMSPRVREVCAMIGIVIGAIALVAWLVIVLGILLASLGLIFSYLGLMSSRTRRARIGLYFSLTGGLLSVLHMLAVYAGLINYNFFTNDLWVLLTISLQK